MFSKMEKRYIKLCNDVDIDRMSGFLSEREYTSGNMRFDIVWRRIDKRSPAYVFEIQVGKVINH